MWPENKSNPVSPVEQRLSVDAYTSKIIDEAGHIALIGIIEEGLQAFTETGALPACDPYVQDRAQKTVYIHMHRQIQAHNQRVVRHGIGERMSIDGGLPRRR